MTSPGKIKLIECPRDAMQGWEEYIPATVKASYINELLQVGFHTIDFGSFVSLKAIPQMRDTAEVLGKLNLSGSSTRLLSIIANERGATDACAFEEISFLGFPFSVSEEFQRRNTNSSIEESLQRVLSIHELCKKSGKELVIYISMAFGNPYGDTWNADIVIHWVGKLAAYGLRTFALSDTIGVSNKDNITHLFTRLIPAFPEIEFGAHLHSTPSSWYEKVDAAVKSGCKRFDAAFRGVGGCPMANDKLTGNLATENLVGYLGGPEKAGLNEEWFKRSMDTAGKIFHLT